MTLRARRALGGEPEQPQALPVPGPGPERARGAREDDGGPLPEIKFFNMGEITIAGRKVRALHHGMSGVPGLELFGPWDDGADVRAAIVEAGEEFGLDAGRLARLRDEHARVGLDPVPAAGRLHRRRHEGVPRVAARERLRGHRLARRQLLLRRHLRLLPDALGSRLRRVRQVRPRLRRARRAREDRGRRPEAEEGHARLERRRRRARDAERCSRRTTGRSTSTCRCPTTRRGRTTRS